MWGAMGLYHHKWLTYVQLKICKRSQLFKCLFMQKKDEAFCGPHTKRPPTDKLLQVIRTFLLLFKLLLGRSMTYLQLIIHQNVWLQGKKTVSVFQLGDKILREINPLRGATSQLAVLDWSIQDLKGFCGTGGLYLTVVGKEVGKIKEEEVQQMVQEQLHWELQPLYGTSVIPLSHVAPPLKTKY